MFMTLFLRYGKGTGILLWAEMAGSAWPALLYKKIFSIPLIIDVDAIIDEAVQFENKSIKTAWRYSMSVFKDTVTLWNAEGLIAVSNKLLAIYKRRLGSLSEHTVVIPCVVDCKMFRFDANVRRTMRETLGLERNFVFVYAGGTQSWQCLDDMLFLFDKIQHSDLFKDFHPLFLLLVWDTSFSLEERARKLNITTTNIFLYNLSHQEIPAYLQASDAAFLLRKDITTNLVSSPTKVGEYLASGLPIITTPFVGDASDIIQKGNVGFILDLDKQYGLKNLQEWCLQVQNTRDQVAFRCIETAQSYFGEAQLSKVKEILQQF
jgi:glycosyltransferase involved in cell wall biosynthesis